MPTLLDLDDTYAKLYANERIQSGKTHQESGSYALQRYAIYLMDNFDLSQKIVLDYGAGTGELVSLLHKRNVICSGVERSSGAREYCRHNRNIELLPDISSVQNSSIDFVTMIEVIEHLTDPLAALREIRLKMRAGGSIFVTTPNLAGARAMIEAGKWREAKKKFHVVLFEASSLQALLRSAGFDSPRRIRYSPILFPGWRHSLSTRIQQALGVGGSLCMIASPTRPPASSAQVSR